MNNIFERSIWEGTNAERVAFTPELTGTVFFETDTGDAYWWDGAAWQGMGGGGGGGHTIQDEGVPLPAEAALNFIGAGVTAVDNPGAGSTDVTIPAPGANNIKMAVFEVSGQLVIASGQLRIYNTLGDDYVIEEVEIGVGTAPTGISIIVDIHKNGVTIFTNQLHRPIIAAGAHQGTTVLIDDDAWDEGDYLTMDIDQIGSIVPGSNLTVMVRARYT